MSKINPNQLLILTQKLAEILIQREKHQARHLRKCYYKVKEILQNISDYETLKKKHG